MDRSSGPLASSIQRLWQWARRHWIISTIGVAAAIGLGIWLIFFFFAVQTLFIDEEVDEALPTFGAPAAPAEAPAPAAEPASPTPAPEPAAATPAAATATETAPAAPDPTPAESSAPAPAPSPETAAEAPAAAPAPADGSAPAPAAAPAEGQLVAGPGASGMPGRRDHPGDGRRDERGRGVGGDAPRGRHE